MVAGSLLSISEAALRAMARCACSQEGGGSACDRKAQ
jgi:hypothetical protein